MIQLIAGAVLGTSALGSSGIEPRIGWDELGAFRQGAVGFEENRGQWDAPARFHLAAKGLDVWASESEIRLDVFRLEEAESIAPSLAVTSRLRSLLAGTRRTGHVIRMRLMGARATSPEALGKSGTHVRRFVDGHAFSSPSYSRLRYTDAFPSIDLILRADGNGLRYDFEVRPGGDPRAIALSFEGAERISIDSKGDLLLETSVGAIPVSSLFAYQEDAHGLQQVDCGFELNEDGEVSFTVGEYDRDRPLIIDPLVSSTFLGGAGADRANGIAVLDSGEVVVVGQTFSPDFPTTVGAYERNYSDFGDAYVAKLSPDLSKINACTFIGGSRVDSATAVAANENGDLTVVGFTFSPDFPVVNPFAGSQGGLNGGLDAFQVTISASLSSIRLSVFEGGGDDDVALGVADMPHHEDFHGPEICGITRSRDFPTVYAFDPQFEGATDGFVISRLLPNEGANWYSTFVGGSGADGCVAIVGNENERSVIAGFTTSSDGGFLHMQAGGFQTSFAGQTDGFVIGIDIEGAPRFATYLGGSGTDVVNAAAIDHEGNVYVAGETQSTDFPTVSAYQSLPSRYGDAFVAKVSADGQTLRYSTYFGGRLADQAYAIAVSEDGSATIAGQTESIDLETTPEAHSRTFGGALGDVDGFVARFGDHGNKLDYCTFLGGSRREAIFAASRSEFGDAFVAGWTSSSGFPVTLGAYSTVLRGGEDAFVSRLSTATLGSFDVSPDELPAGVPGVGRVVLSTTTAEPCVVSLTSSHPEFAGVPASVTVPPGERVATFQVDVGQPPAALPVTFTATFRGRVLQESVLVMPIVLDQITVAPNWVTGGSSSSGTVRITGPAPLGGMPVTLTSNHPDAVVPPSVVIPTGEDEVSFAIATSPVANSATALIRAIAGGNAVQASLTILHPVVESVTVEPNAVLGGTPSVGRVRLTGPAPQGGSLVTLRSAREQAAAVPPALTVSAATREATFPITTYTILDSTLVAITASRFETRSAGLYVRGIQVTRVSLSPSTVRGGRRSTATVTISSPAPPGFSLSLRSSDGSVATVPATVSFSPGRTTATFRVTTRRQPATRVVEVTAWRGDSQSSATLTVTR